MTEIELNNILEKLESSSDTERAYIGYHEWTPHEFCIKGNSDGLKLFAAELLRASNLNEEKEVKGFGKNEMPWYDNDLDIHFIEYTKLARKEIVKPKSESNSNNFLSKILIAFLLILIAYIFISAVIFNFKLIF